MNFADSIVRIIAPDGKTVGSGFLVHDEGLIATCAHVVQFARGAPRSRIKVRFRGANRDLTALVEQRFWREPYAEDVAIIRLEDSVPDGVAALPLAGARRVAGRTLRSFGFPDLASLEGLPAMCDVSDWTNYRGLPMLSLRGSEVTAGFSGAPVWDAQLEAVVGMVNAILRPDEYGRMGQTILALPSEALWGICPNIRPHSFCPYRGLEPFEPIHAGHYFGRERAIRHLFKRLSRFHLVAVVGSSGSGKSSLLRAGVEKGLRGSAVPGLADRPRCVFTPGSTPLLDLILALARGCDLAPRSVTDFLGLEAGVLSGNEQSLWKANDALSNQTCQLLSSNLRSLLRGNQPILIVDQFERLYVECEAERARSVFLNTLLELVDFDVKVLLALRDDFYGSAFKHNELAKVLAAVQMNLLPMSDDELRAAILQPARSVGVQLQPQLLERLIADVRGQAGNLPLLQFALLQLWERDAERGILTLGGYESLGYTAPNGQTFPGLHGAIAKHAESIWSALTPDEQLATKRVFLHLITPGRPSAINEGAALDFGRKACLAEWDKNAQAVAEQLVSARLLTAGMDHFTGLPIVEVAHESLVRAWPRLQLWVDEYRPFLRWYDHDLRPYLRSWLEHERDVDLLLPQSLSDKAADWLSQFPEILQGPASEYILLSQSWRANEDKRRREGYEAERQHKFRLARRLAVQAADIAALGAGERELSVLLAAESLRLVPSALSSATLCIGLASLLPLVVRLAPQLSAKLVALSEEGRWLARADLLGTVEVWEIDLERRAAQFDHESAIEVLALSRDGQWLAIASRSGPVHVHHVATRQRVVLNCVSPVEAFAFNPNGHFLATRGRDHIVRLWEVPSGLEATSIKHDDPILAMAFSSDGRLLATTTSKSVLVWRLNTERLAAVFSSCQREAVAFSPDGSRLITAGLDGTAELWDVATGHNLACMQYIVGPDGAAELRNVATGPKLDSSAHRAAFETMALSPNGRLLAATTHNEGVRAWETSTGRELALERQSVAAGSLSFSPEGRFLAGLGINGAAYIWGSSKGQVVAQIVHESTIEAIAFSHDGRFLGSASCDRTARIWDPLSGRELARFRHPGTVQTLAFSPDSRWLATGSLDGVARVWPTTGGEEAVKTLHRDWVGVVAFSPDGRWLATGSGDATACIMEVSTKREMFRLQHGEAVVALAFSHDGRWLATGSGDATVRIWEVCTGHQVAGVSHDISAGALAISPDGLRVAAGSRDHTVRLWAVPSGLETARMRHEAAVLALAFSPDGRWLATAGCDKTARVWDVATGQEAARMAHQDWVGALAFSADGDWLATGDGGSVLRVWHVPTWQEVTRIGCGGAVNALMFSLDGRFLAAAGADRTVRILLWRAEDLISEACRVLTRNLSQEERDRYLPGQPYGKTCSHLP